MSASPTMPAAIASYVSEYAAVRRRRRLGRALGRAAMLSLAWVILACAIDRAFALPGSVRLGMLIANLLAVLIILSRPLAGWVLRRTDWLEAADDIERRNPRLGQRLQTVASQHLSDARYRGSSQIIDRLSDEVAIALSAASPHRLLPVGPVVRPWLVAGMLAGFMVLLSLLPLLGLPTLLLRYMMPLARIAPVTTTHLGVTPGDTNVLEGNNLTIQVAAQRVGDRPVTLHYQKNGVAARVVMPRSGPGTYQVELGPLDRDMPYHVSGGDAQSPTYTARILRRPVVKQFEIRYVYPDSTRRESLTVSNTDGLIEAPVGTEATVRVTATEFLSGAAMVVPDGVIPLERTDDPSTRSAILRVEHDAIYTLRMTTSANIPGEHEGGVIRAIPDAPPLVQLRRPAIDLRLHPRDITALPYEALDDYGLAEMSMRTEVLASGHERIANNLALNKPTRQSTTPPGAVPARAVDGDIAPNAYTRTQAAANSWWEVDLGAVESIGVVELWDTDLGTHPQDVQVIVGDAPLDGAADLAELFKRPDVTRYTVSGIVARPSTVEVRRDGRYVRVLQPGKAALALAEVRVLQDVPAQVRNTRLPGRPAGPVVTPLHIVGDPRRQEGEVRLDLATLNVAVGDVVLISVSGTDTAGQTRSSETCRILVMPRSIDLATYERIAELKSAEQHSQELVRELEEARRSLPHLDPRNQHNRGAYLDAVSRVSRHLSEANEAAGRLLPSLLRATARSNSSQFATSMSHFADAAQSAASAAEKGQSQIGFGEGLSPDADTNLQQALDDARRTRDELKTISEGERAAAVLADRDNLKAAEAEPVPDDPQVAERVKQRNQRLRDDIAAAARELRLNPSAPDLDNQLQQKVDAAERLMQSKPMLDFEQPARTFAEELKSAPAAPHALPDRLRAAAQAEAVRPDADLVRARDMALASTAAENLDEQARAEARQQRNSRSSNASTPSEPSPSAQDSSSASASSESSDGQGQSSQNDQSSSESSASSPSPEQFPQAMAALRREHELNRKAPSEVDPAERDRVQAEASAARQQMSQWAGTQDQQTVQPSQSSATEQQEQSALADAAAMAQGRPMPTGSPSANRSSSSSSAASQDEPGRPQASQGDSRMERLQAEMQRASEMARELDDLIEQQRRLRDATATTPGPQARNLAEPQRELAGDIGAVAPSEFSQIANDEPDSRARAAGAITTAQEQLAAMPQVLTLTHRAAQLWWRTQRVAQEAARQAELAPFEDQPLAQRVAATAQQQALEAQARLEGVSAPIDPQAAAAMAVGLAPFTPETAKAVRSLGTDLAPALTSLQRSIQSADESGTDRAIADTRGAIAQVQQDLSEAQNQLMDRNPLMAARAYAEAAARSLDRSEPDTASAVASQSSAEQALSRAADEAIHRAAAARMAQAPSLAAILGPPMPGLTADVHGNIPGSSGQVSPVAPPGARDWGRLQARQQGDLNIAPADAAPPGYQDALRAYFEALGQMQTDGETNR